MHTFTTFIQHSIGSPSHSNQSRKRNKKNPNWKGRSEAVTIADDLILYTENPKDATKKLLELINEFGKVSGHKINIRKSVAFLYTNNNQKEKLTTPLTNASKRIKYLGLNLTKEVKDLYLENCKTLMKETEDDTNR